MHLHERMVHTMKKSSVFPFFNAEVIFLTSFKEVAGYLCSMGQFVRVGLLVGVMGILHASVLQASTVRTFSFTRNIKEAYQDLISFRYQEGQRWLEREKRENPNNLLPYFLENIPETSGIFIREEEEEFDRLKGNKDRRLSMMEQGDPRSPFFLYTQAELHLQWALARVKFEEYTTAALELNRAYRMLNENKKKFPNFPLNNKGLGLLHVMIGTIPDSYKWAVQLLGIRGTIKTGVSELRAFYKIASTDSAYSCFRTEATVFLGMVLINYTNHESEAVALMDVIERERDVNPMLAYIYSSIGLKTGRSEEVVAFQTRYRQGKNLPSFPFLDLQFGQAKLFRLDVDADVPMLQFLKQFKGLNYIKSCHQHLAWHYLVHGKSDKFQYHWKEINGIGSIVVDEDKQALKNFQNNAFPNPMLLRARLLCDGGFYAQSLKVLAEVKPASLKTPEQQLEYIYRLGRVYAKTGALQLAIANYEKTYEEGASQPFYFAEASAVQLGLIYENQGNKEKAEYYFHKALDVKKHAFKNSLDQKAKAGLNRLSGS